MEVPAGFVFVLVRHRCGEGDGSELLHCPLETFT